jgi:hypothetical protein
MAISARNKKLINGPSVEPIILLEFLSFLDQDWGRMSPYGDVEILDSGTVRTFYDYFISFPQIGHSFDPLKGGLDKVSNISVILNNNEDLVKSLRAVNLENTEVKIYVLLNAGGILDKSDAELRFYGIVDLYGVTWDEEKVTIKISEISQKSNQDVLKTKLTKTDFPTMDDSLDGKWLPIIGGEWSTNQRDSETSDDSDYLNHAVALNCATPTFEMNTEDNRFLIADHPVKTTTSELCPTNTYNETPMSDFPNLETRREMGLVFQYNPNDQLLPCYNNTGQLQSDNTMLFVMPPNTKSIQGMIRPKLEVENDSLITNPGDAIDDDLIVEVGVNCQTFNNYPSDEFKIQWFNFGDIFDTISLDPHKSIVTLEVLCEGTSGKGRFLMRTDGNSVYAGPGSADGIEFFAENGTSNTYRIKQEGNDDTPEDALFEPSSTVKNFKTINLVLNNWYSLQFNFLNKSTWNIVDNGGGDAFRRTPVPTNATTPVDLKFSEIEPVLLNADRLKNWSFGIEGKNLKVKRVFLRLTDVYYKGGHVPPAPLRYFEGEPIYTYNLLGQQTSVTYSPGKEINPENYDKWFEHKQEQEARSNTNPLFVMIDGYTDTNLVGGTLVTEPNDHLKYILEHRMGLTSSSWDSSSFTTTAGRRQAVVGHPLQYQWQQHVAITAQKKAHAALAMLAQESNCIIFHYIDKFYTRDTDWGYSYESRWPVVASWGENEILEYKFSKQKQVYDSIVINYAYDYASGNYRRKLFATPFDTNYYDENDDVFGNISIDNYDVTGLNSVNIKNGLKTAWEDIFQETNETDPSLHELEVNLDTVQSVHTARRVFALLANKFSKLRSICEFTVGASGMVIGLGDTIYLGHVDFASGDIGNYLVYSIVENLATQEYQIKALNISGG